MARNTNRTVTIKAKGIEQVVTDVKQLDKVVTDLQSEFNKLSGEISKMAAASKTDIKGLKAEIDQLNKALEKLKNSSGNVNTALSQTAVAADNVKKSFVQWRKEVGENYRRMEVSEIEGLDQILDKTLSVRKRTMGAVSTAAALIEQLGVSGKVAGFSLKLLSPIIGDIGEELSKAAKESKEFQQALDSITNTGNPFAALASWMVGATQKADELWEKLYDMAAVLAFVSPIMPLKMAGVAMFAFRDETFKANVQMYKLADGTKVTYQEFKKVEAQLKKVADAIKTVRDESAKEVAQIDALFGPLLDVNAAYADRERSLIAINEKYKDLLGNQQLEINNLTKIRDAYDMIRASIIKKIALQAAEKEITAIYGRMIQIQVDSYNKFGALGRDMKLPIGKTLTEELKGMEGEIDKISKLYETIGKDTLRALMIDVKWWDYNAKKLKNLKGQTKELEKQYDLIRKMNEESVKSAKDDFDNLLNSGDLDAATEALRKYLKERTEMRRNEAGKFGKEGANAQRKIEEEQARLRAAEEAFQQTVNDVESSINKISKNANFEMMLQGKLTSLNADLFEGLNIDSKWKKGNLVAVVKDRMGNQTEEAGRIFWRIVTKFRDIITNTVMWDDVFEELNKYGITSVFTDIYAKQATDLFILEQEAGREIDKQNEILKKIGAKSLDGFDAETKKNAIEMQKKIDEARAARNKALRDAEAKSKIDIIKTMKTLGFDFSFEQYLESLEAKMQQDIDAFKTNLITNINSFGEIAKDLKFDFDSDNLFVNPPTLESLEAKGFSPDEVKQLIDYMLAMNDAWALLRREQAKTMSQAAETYTGAALESFNVRSADIMKQFKNDYDYLEIVYNEQMRNLETLEEKRYDYGFGKRRKQYKKEVDQSITYLKELWELEDKIASGAFIDELNRIQKEGGDIEKYIEEYLIERLKIATKRGDEVRDLEAKKKGPMTPEDIVKFITQTVSQGLDVAKGAYEYLDALSQALIDKLEASLEEVEAQLSESEARLGALESDLEAKISGRRDAVLAAMDLEKQRAEDLANTKIQLERKILAEQEKAAKRRKAMAIAEAAINGALAIMQIWAAPNAFPFPFGQIAKGISTAAMAATTALQIATINATPYAEGGYTGQGTERDSTGHKVAGVVHDGEWVAPKWMVNSPKFANTIASLESARTRRFAEGGATSPETLAGISSALNPNTNLSRQMEALTKASIALSNRPVIADVKEFSNVQSASYKRMRTNTIG